MNNMTHQEMIEFVERCLYSEDGSYVENFKKLNFFSQIYFIQEMFQVFKNWNETDFKKFSERNAYNGIFDNLTFDAWTYFMINLRIDYDFNNSRIVNNFCKYVTLDMKPILSNYYINFLERNHAEIQFGVDHNKNSF